MMAGIAFVAGVLCGAGIMVVFALCALSTFRFK